MQITQGNWKANINPERGSLGFTRTEARLVADPNDLRNRHEVEIAGAFGTMRIELANAPLPENPRTSWLAALSVEAAVRRHFRPLQV